MCLSDPEFSDCDLAQHWPHLPGGDFGQQPLWGLWLAWPILSRPCARVHGLACLRPSSAFLLYLLNHGSWGEEDLEAGGKDKTSLPSWPALTSLHLYGPVLLPL